MALSNPTETSWRKEPAGREPQAQKAPVSGPAGPRCPHSALRCARPPPLPEHLTWARRPCNAVEISVTILKIHAEPERTHSRGTTWGQFCELLRNQALLAVVSSFSARLRHHSDKVCGSSDERQGCDFTATSSLLTVDAVTQHKAQTPAWGAGGSERRVQADVLRIRHPEADDARLPQAAPNHVCGLISHLWSHPEGVDPAPFLLPPQQKLMTQTSKYSGPLHERS